MRLADPQYQKVKDLFSSAIELPRDEWPSFIFANTVDEPEIAAEVFRLLDHHCSETIHQEPPKRALTFLEEASTSNPWTTAWANLIRNKFRRVSAAVLLLLLTAAVGFFFSRHLKTAMVDQWSAGAKGAIAVAAAGMERWADAEIENSSGNWSSAKEQIAASFQNQQFQNLGATFKAGKPWKLIDTQGKVKASDWPKNQNLFTIRVPIQANGKLLGHLLIGHAPDERFRDMLQQDFSTANSQWFAITAPKVAISQQGGQYHGDLSRFPAPGYNKWKASSRVATGAVLEPYIGSNGQPSAAVWAVPRNLDVVLLAEWPWQDVIASATIVDQAITALGSTAFGLAIWSLISSFRLARMRRDRSDSQLGDYQILRMLSRGGMGEVYLARHRTLKRYTAIKLMRDDRWNHNFCESFEQEATLAASLRHPNTISVFDFGRTDDGALYYVMEYVDGLTLHDLVRRYGPQETARVCFLLEQVCSSLEEAHHLGLVHRDIKPSNIMITQLGRLADHIKVLDFGLAKAFGTSVSQSDWMVAGTEHYSAPETMQGQLTVTERADVYSVGAVGFWLLTGKKPYRRAEAEADRYMDPARKQLLDLFNECLEEDAQKRPASVAELRKRLEALCLAELWHTNAAQWWKTEYVPQPEARPMLDFEQLAEEFKDSKPRSKDVPALNHPSGPFIT
jgi:tRNA A-37 threonylcarbamoyl transferase component Bud32